MASRQEPYSGFSKPQIIVGVTEKMLRPAMENLNCPFAYNQLMSDCWTQEPGKRPSFTEILHRLEQIKLSTSMNITKSSSSETFASGKTSMESVCYWFFL
jgi:hypothetical protein